MNSMRTKLYSIAQAARGTPSLSENSQKVDVKKLCSKFVAGKYMTRSRNRSHCHGIEYESPRAKPLKTLIHKTNLEKQVAATRNPCYNPCLSTVRAPELDTGNPEATPLACKRRNYMAISQSQLTKKHARLRTRMASVSNAASGGTGGDDGDDGDDDDDGLPRS